MLDNKALHLQNVDSHYVSACVLYVIYVCMYMYMYTIMWSLPILHTHSHPE